MAEQSGIAVTPAAPRSIAGIGVFHNRGKFLAAMQAELGVTIPKTPCFVQAGPITLSCLAPTRYLASAGPEVNLPSRLGNTMAGLAAITDQSDMWVTFTLSGPLTPSVLARLVPIDVDPDIFRVGDVALTRAGHLDVRLWRLAALDYEVAVLRSYAEYFYAILTIQVRGLPSQ